MGGGKKKGKKGGGGSSKAAAAVDNELSGVIDSDDDGTITREDCVAFAKMIMASGKQLGKIATDFLEVFKNRCMLSIGYAMVLYHEVIGNTDVDKEKRFVLPRIVIVYLVYRSRDLEPWLRRQRERGKENLTGHPFIEFFFTLARGTEAKFLPAREVPVHEVEMKMARLILGRRGHELEKLTPNELYDKFLHPHFSVPDPATFKDLADKFKAQSARWPAHIETKTVPAIIFHPLMHVVDFSGDDPIELTTDELIYIAQQLWLIQMSKMPFEIGTKLLPHTPVGSESWEKYFVPGGVARQEKRTAVTELHSEVEVDGESIPVVELVPVEDAGTVPEASTSAAMERKLPDVKVPVAKILKNEKLTNQESHDLMYYLQRKPIDDDALKPLVGLSPESYPGIVDSDPRLASILFMRLICHDDSLLPSYVEQIMELGVNLLSLEIILRAYRSFKHLSKAVLTDYLVFVMKRIDTETSSSSLRARSVRISCLFVSTLLQEGIIDTTNPLFSNMLTELNHFLIKYSEVKEASRLYQVLIGRRRLNNEPQQSPESPTEPQETEESPGSSS